MQRAIIISLPFGVRGATHLLDTEVIICAEDSDGYHVRTPSGFRFYGSKSRFKLLPTSRIRRP